MILEDVLPGALFIGISYDVFWRLNPVILAAHFNAYKEHAKQKNERRNAELWLQGVYIQYAVASVLNKRNKYPKKPLALDGEAGTAQEAAQKFGAFVEEFNRRRRCEN